MSEKEPPLHSLDEDGNRLTVMPDGTMFTRDDVSRLEENMRRAGREALTPEVARALTEGYEWEGVDNPAKIMFLSALAVCGVVAMASRIAGINRNTIYSSWQHDEAFMKQFNFAKTRPACDILEAEAWRRAVDGVDKPLFHNGEVVATITTYSDTLLQTLLKANMPEKYGTRVKLEVADDSRVAPEIPTDEDRQKAVIALFGSLHGLKPGMTDDGPTEGDSVN